MSKYLRFALSCLGLMVMAGVQPVIAADESVPQKPAAAGKTVKVLVDDAPENVKVFFTTSHQLAIDDLLTVIDLREMYVLNYELNKNAKVDPNESNPRLVAEGKVIRREDGRKERLRIISQLIEHQNQKIADMSDPNFMVHPSLIGPDTKEPKVGQIGSVSSFHLDSLRVNEQDGKMASILGTISYQGEYQSNMLKIRVMIRGLQPQNTDAMQHQIRGMFFEVKEIQNIDGQNLPVLEPFDLDAYQWEMPIEDYEKLYGTRIQWPAAAMVLSPERLAATQPSTTQPATEKVGN